MILLFFILNVLLGINNVFFFLFLLKEIALWIFWFWIKSSTLSIFIIGLSGALEITIIPLFKYYILIFYFLGWIHPMKKLIKLKIFEKFKNKKNKKNK